MTKIIVKLQAYKFNQQIKRTIDSRIRLPLVTPLMPEVIRDDETDIGELFEEDEANMSIDSERRKVTANISPSENKRKDDEKHFSLL